MGGVKLKKGGGEYIYVYFFRKTRLYLRMRYIQPYVALGAAGAPAFESMEIISGTPVRCLIPHRQQHASRQASVR